MGTLSGKTILSTRPYQQDDKFKRLLVEKGAVVIDFPMIKTECIELNPSELNVNDYQWIVFTSKNAISCFVSQLKKLDYPISELDKIKFAVVGEATAQELEIQTGCRPFIHPSRNSKELAEALMKNIHSKDAVLLVLGELADSKLEAGLSRKASIKRVNIYKTIDLEYDNHPAIDILKKGEFDLIVFTSPSGYRNFLHFAERIQLKNHKAACIGATTAAELSSHGQEVLICSQKPEAVFFVKEIEDYFIKLQ